MLLAYAGAPRAGPDLFWYERVAVDAEDVLAQYRALYEKYVGFFRTELRPEERTKIISREIYAKLDAATYAAIPSTDEAEAKKK